MSPPPLSEIAIDLLRSCWIVEEARILVYGRWAGVDDKYAASVERSRERTAIVEKALEQAGAPTDPALVEPHSRWMRNLVGEQPEGLAPLLLTRLGDWVEGHVGMLLSESLERVKELGDQEREGLIFPDIPPIPPFELLDTPAAEPPGEVLFRIGILGDAHIGSPGAEERVRAAIQDLNGARVDLVVQMGDITDEGSSEQFERAKDVLATLQVPFATMMGNHDVLARREGGALEGRELYGSHFGREPEGVILEHKGFRLAILDSVEHKASPFAPFDLVSGKFVEGPGGAVVRGSFTPSQHDLLADIAEPGSPPTFVFLHHPPQPYTGFPPVLFGLRDEDSGRLHATVDSGNVWGVFAGHTHRNARTRDYDGVPAQEVGVPRDFPFGYAVIDVTEDGYAYNFHQISNEELLREGYAVATELHRRYATGTPEERAFVWKR